MYVAATRYTPCYSSQGLDLARIHSFAREKRRDFGNRRDAIFFGDIMREVARWVSHAAWQYDGAHRLSKINYQEEDLRERERRKGGGRAGWLYRVPSRVHGRVQETPETKGRRGCDRQAWRENEARRRRRRHWRSGELREWNVRQGVEEGYGGRHRPTTKKQLTTTVARRTERWKSILWNRSVLSELACYDQMKPGESLPWSWRIHRNFILRASLKEIQSNDFDSEEKNRYTYVSDFILKFDIRRYDHSDQYFRCGWINIRILLWRN